MKKLLIIIVACIVGWFALGEGMRAYGRALVEKDMRAAFNSIPLTCSGAVRDDICLAAPDEGRCLSGEYIDYRTIWKRVDGLAQMETLLASKLKELGSGRRLANWLACQGFSMLQVDHNGTPADIFDDIRFITGPHIHPSIQYLPSGKLRDVKRIEIRMGFRLGNSALTTGKSTFPLAQPLRFVTEPSHAYFGPAFIDEEMARISYQRPK